MAKRTAHSTFQDLMGALKPALAACIQAVDDPPFKVVACPLVETDVSKIWVLKDDDPKVVKILRTELSDMTIEAIVHNVTDELLLLETRGESANAARRRLKLNRKEYGIEDIQGTSDGSRVASTEFVHEALLSIGLSKSLLDGQKTPHVTRSVAAYLDKSTNRGCLVMERIHCTMYEALRDRCGVKLEPRAVAGMYLQVMHALAIAQTQCNLKHHDLHDKNVFIKKLVPGTMWKGVDLSVAKYFKYSAGPHVFYVENCGYLPQLADFGLSSGTVDGVALERVDLGLMGGGSDDEDSEDWGEWTPDITHRRGYDLQVLFSEDPVPKRSRLSRSAALEQLGQRLVRAVNAGHGTVSSRGRPLIVSDIPPEHVLITVFTAPSNALYDFVTKPKEGSTVADMGSIDPRPYVQPPPPKKKTRAEDAEDVEWCTDDKPRGRSYSPERKRRKRRGKKGGAK
jgi:hypothetical protein